ncbi:MAG TPA: LysR substrate-binding domain-containing protein [Polyangiaceae bacterium]|nr:LysR substrate-binding domain-containing protein [Polyangiaceae bacterium]
MMHFAHHPFTLRQLQYAVAIGDTLSFRKAAERCHVSQPSLSIQLAELEQGLGVQLFERDQRHVRATKAGQELLERARRLLRDADDLQDLASRSADPFCGTLHLGVIPTVAPYLLPRLTPALQRAYPKLTLLWVEDKTETLVHNLDTGTVDAALLALEADVGNVASAVVGYDPFVLATPPNHPLGAKAAPARPSELRDENVLLLDDGHCFRDQALTFCTHAKAHELEFRATSLPTLTQMVAAGAGVTLLPQMAVPIEAERANLCIRELTQPVPGRTIALIWRKGSANQIALAHIAETIKTAYGAAPRARRTR